MGNALTCQQFAGDVIVGSDGRWLGDFSEVYHPSPFPTDLGDPVWPVGFTPVGWFAGTREGHNSATPYVQWRHGTDVFCKQDPDAPSDHYWIDSGAGLYSDRVIAPYSHVTGPATDEAADWPVANFSDWIYSAADLRVVADASGPAGMEDVNALEVDFSGVGNNEGFTFVGEGGGFIGSGPVDPNYGDETDRSATGWVVPLSSCWTLDFWVKPVPDVNGYVCTGAGIGSRWGFYPDFMFHGPVMLAGGWQHFQQDSTWWDGTITGYQMNNAVIGIGGGPGNAVGCPDPWGAYTVASRKGRVHIKCLHLYPCGTQPQGVHVKKRIGTIPPP